MHDYIIVGGNPNAAIMLIGERAADFIAADEDLGGAANAQTLHAAAG